MLLYDGSAFSLQTSRQLIINHFANTSCWKTKTFFFFIIIILLSLSPSLFLSLSLFLYYTSSSLSISPQKIDAQLLIMLVHAVTSLLSVLYTGK
jgi:hypothetical protein